MAKSKEVEVLSVFINRINKGYYQLSNFILTRNGREIGSVTHNGYLYHRLANGGVYAHRLIFAYYHGIDELHKYETINHIDGNKLNNDINNLEGLSLAENSKHQWKIGLAKRGEECTYAKLTEQEVKQIKKLLNIGYSQGKIAELYKVHRGTILGINLKNIWAHVDYEDNITIPYINGTKLKRSDRKFNDTDIERIKSLHVSGISQTKIAQRFNVSRGTIKKVVNDVY